MISLLKRDFYLIRTNFIIITTVILFISIPLLFLNNDIVILVVTVIPSIYFFMMYPCFTYDTKVKWNLGLGIMPIQKQTIVLSRFCLFGLLCIFGVFISILISILFMFIFKGASLVEPSILLMIGGLIPLLCGGCFLPSIYIFNNKHIETAFLLSCFIPTQLLALLYKIFVTVMNDNLAFKLPVVLLILNLIVILFIGVSCFICCRVYQRKWRKI